MKIDEAYPEAYRLAKRFHEFYEQSAPAFGYETKEETKEFDPESPNGRLMAWVCYEIVKEEIDKYKEALIWCSGSDDFQLEGKARKGWEKICIPLIQ